jgi:hypothetical protein
MQASLFSPDIAKSVVDIASYFLVFAVGYAVKHYFMPGQRVIQDDSSKLLEKLVAGYENPTTQVKMQDLAKEVGILKGKLEVYLKEETNG